MPNFADLKILLEKYFPGVHSAQQLRQFETAFAAYLDWNLKVNLISRKDVENLAERHFLHSLGISKAISFAPGTRILDAGTGGGFPGIPLAIMFPEVQFHLVDSRQKKISVVQDIVRQCGLANVQYSVQRVEQLGERYDFVVSRAVAAMEKFIPWVKGQIHCKGKNGLRNGILYLRGGNIYDEMRDLPMKLRKNARWDALPLSDYFEGEFFETKFLLHLSWC